ncbi:MotA/TolQ/ExbB proton channel family protein [Sphingomonas morindae]|uniref:MotA/TolQ/ExbB proton channel family protein n=1 Tax=Sphingomonas morindae TaxID=1541170 RepID=A0ABY4XC88_9SPHN|nr:MotA/TolQ/ExbB proton channel family protein [Sphingomonas morindae]USI74489.1 MotA/TolQ/ExbB proton channel family protein [Sphingomonas morindae]
MQIFLDPVAPLLVIGGSLALAAARATGRDARRALAALRPLVTARPAADAEAAGRAVQRIIEKANRTGIATCDRAKVEHFLAQVAIELADARDAAAFRAWAEAELDARAARHAGVQAVWRAAADTAPAMGMIGTVLGLIAMFQAMDDVSRIGPGMALALTTTLYGMIAANCLFGPIAARLERLGEVEREWQAQAVARLAALAEAELTPLPMPMPAPAAARAAPPRLRPAA